VGHRLRGLGLRVEEVSKDGVANTLRYRQQRSVLSVPDSFALALAKERQWVPLTGDGRLRELAGAEKVEWHGVLWLIDMMEAGAHRASNSCMMASPLLPHIRTAG
jgi:hypothetical protein